MAGNLKQRRSFPMHNRLLDLEEQFKQAASVKPPKHPVKKLHRPARLPTYPRQAAEKTSQEQALHRRAKALTSPMNYTIPGHIFPVAQDKNMACWAAGTAIMMSWKAQQSITITEAMQRLGAKYMQIYQSNTGLFDRDSAALAAAAGFEVEPPMSFSVEGWEQLLRRYGPLFVFTAHPNLAIHGRVIKAISGDGTPAGTQVSVLDPAGGREYPETVQALMDSFEREARETKNPLRIQLFHYPAGTRPGSMSYSYGYYYADPFQQSTAIFTPQAITRMRDFFIQNAMGGSPMSCISTMNEGLRRLFDNRNIPVGSEVQTTMEALRQAGRATDRYDIEFRDSSGNATRGERPPETLSESLIARMRAMNGNAAGWSVFGLSLMDGYHSVLLSLDNTDPAQPRIYWSDQWPENQGWLALDGPGLDARVNTLTKRFYPKFIEERRIKTGKHVLPRTRASLWMVLP
jgi:hypothetical protein